MSAFMERVRAIPRGIDTLREWIGSEDGIPVSPELAQRRADVCLKCPKNIQGSVLTGAIAEAVRRHLEFKSDLGFRVKGERQLGECEICRCQLRLKIHVPISIIRKQMPAGEWEMFPSPCFQRDEK